jgi:hypothetical protein
VKLVEPETESDEAGVCTSCVCCSILSSDIGSMGHTPCVMESVSKLLMAKGLKAFVRYQEEVASDEKRSLLDLGRAVN